MLARSSTREFHCARRSTKEITIAFKPRWLRRPDMPRTSLPSPVTLYPLPSPRIQRALRNSLFCAPRASRALAFTNRIACRLLNQSLKPASLHRTLRHNRGIMIPFVKAHACGNDFLIIEEQLAQRRHAELARKLCARNISVGADGIEFLERKANGDLFLRLFNADGSEAELSGNGTRCVAAWLARSER